MSASIRGSSCANHPHRSADGNCASCGKPICDQCGVEFVATEQTFCSERCRDAMPAEPGRRRVDNATLQAGLEKPIRIGWALAARSSGRIAVHVLPFAVVAALLFAFLNQTTGGAVAVAALLVLLLGGAFAVALVGVILSARHTGLVEDAPYSAAARRFVPWVVTLILMMGVTIVGYFALILPGIYLSLRLFWADEFALVHNKNPIDALRASWELTRKQAGDVFVFQFILGLASYVVVFPAVFLFMGLMMGLDAIGLGGDPESLSPAGAFLFFLAGPVIYGALHGPEIVQFYGKRAARSHLEACVAPAAVQRSRGLVAAGIVLAGVLGFGVIGALFVPNFLNAIEMGKGKRTFMDSREIAIAMESFAEANNRYPEAANIEELRARLVPEYASTIPMVDGWKRPFRVVSTPMDYEIRSAGKDGVFEELPPRGATFDFDDDIVWRNAEALQWPDYLGLE